MEDERSQFNPAKFPSVTKQALDFYKQGASEDEKKAVATTILKAAKKIKKEARANPENKKDRKKGRQQPNPEQLAAGLYKVLSETGSIKVSGDPAGGAQTRLQGQVDLNEVARKLLSLDPRRRPE
jgi:hypothetical protein